MQACPISPQPRLKLLAAVSVSYMELYKEQVNDLLQPANTNLPIRQSREKVHARNHFLKYYAASNATLQSLTCAPLHAGHFRRSTHKQTRAAGALAHRNTPLTRPPPSRRPCISSACVMIEGGRLRAARNRCCCAPTPEQEPKHAF